MPFVDTKELVTKEVIRGYTAKSIHTGTMTFMYWTVEAGAEMPMHQHIHEQVAHVLKGRFELTVNGEKRILEPGIVAVIPPNVLHGGKALTDCELLDVFNPKEKIISLAMSKVKEAYNEWAKSYDVVKNKTRGLDKVAIQTIVSNIEFNDVLKLGCGTRKNTQWLKEKARTVTAVDFSDEMTAKAKEKIKSNNVEFVQADISKQWNFNKKFDLITCNLMLEHIKDLEHIFINAYKSLKQGGYVFISELHPFKQYTGSKARFEKEGKTIVLECYTHHASEYFTTASSNGFTCKIFKEWFNDENEKEIPRLIGFLFKKI